MALQTLNFTLDTADRTVAWAASLAPELTAGDVILLQGDVGAGKTHFARALIQAKLGRAEDVPSPTFTLVQSYETETAEIWHADLYRLTSTQEIEELGLIDAFETEICLIEWPDRLGDLTPENALTVCFSAGDAEEARLVRLEWHDPRWAAKIGKGPS